MEDQEKAALARDNTIYFAPLYASVNYMELGKTYCVRCYTFLLIASETISSEGYETDVVDSDRTLQEAERASAG